MGSNEDYVVAAIAEERVAVQVCCVERVVRAAEITTLPDAPKPVMGALNYRGAVLPVFSARLRFNLEQPPLRTTDQFLILHTGRRRAILVVDSAMRLARLSEDDIRDAAELTGAESRIRGVARLPDGLAVIIDVEHFLSPEEEEQLHAALSAPNDQVQARCLPKP